MTIDLRGLGAALRAHAKTRQLTVAATARSLIAASLEQSLATTAAGPDGTRDVATPVKLTLRMRASAAHLLAQRARAAGLPYGAFVGTLLDGSPAPALVAEHRVAAIALGVSTEQLAALSTDINALIRMVSRDSVAEAAQLRERIGTLADDVRGHLALSSRLMASLAPVTVAARRGPRTPADGARLP